MATSTLEEMGMATSTLEVMGMATSTLEVMGMATSLEILGILDGSSLAQAILAHANLSRSSPHTFAALPWPQWRLSSTVSRSSKAIDSHKFTRIEYFVG